MLQETIAAARLWLGIRMVGVVMVPVFWLLFALEFSGIRLKGYQKLLLWVIPAASYLLFLTRAWQDLYVRRIHFSEIEGYMIDLSWTLGSLFWIHFLFGYLLMIAGSYFIIQKAFQLRRKYRKQAVVLALGALVPLAINFSSYFDLIPQLRVNYDPVGFLFAGLALTYAMYRLRLFDLLPIAQQALIDSMRDGMLVLDLDNRIMDLNPSAEQILNEQEKNLIGRSVSESSLFPDALGTFVETASSGQTEITLGDEESSATYLVELNALHRDGRDIGNLLVIKDITEQRRRERSLWEDASRDHLTGVYNRRFLSEVGEREFRRASRHGHPLSLILFDLDNFKRINDTYGHLAGDELLKKVAEACQKITREEDILARYGGDEFVILCLDTSREGACDLAERIRDEVEGTVISYQGQVLEATASLGVTTLEDDDPESIMDLIKQADQALYQAKRDGRNQVSCWDNPAAQAVG
jgi:diguanylate cyclase (GGDEF)-like protein/PAS domain S-box-containing protein